MAFLKVTFWQIFHILAQFSYIDHPMTGIYNTYNPMTGIYNTYMYTVSMQKFDLEALH